MPNQNPTAVASSAVPGDLEQNSEVRSDDGWIIRRCGQDISVMAPEARPGMVTLVPDKGPLPERLLYALGNRLLRAGDSGATFRSCQPRASGSDQHADAVLVGEHASCASLANAQLQRLILEAIGPVGSATLADIASNSRVLALAKPLARTTGESQLPLGAAIEALIHVQLKHLEAANVLHAHDGVWTSNSALHFSLPEAERLVRFFGQHNDAVVVRQFAPRKSPTGEEWPSGLYAWSQDYPEEGAEFLGPHNPDDDVSATIVWQGHDADAGEALRLLRAYRQAVKFGSHEQVARTIEIENEIDALLANHA